MSVRVTMTASATEPQLVKCLFCRREFVTELTVSYCADDDIGTMYHGEVRRKLSRAVASERIAKELADVERCDPVPCPNCLRYQPYMARQLAREPHRSLALTPGWAFIVLGILLTALGGAAFLSNSKFGDRRGDVWGLTCPAVGLLMIAVGGFIVGRVRRAVRTFDADTLPESERRRDADERARTRADYDRKQQRRARRLYAEHAPQPRDGNPYSEPEPLVLTWWVLPSVLTDGGTILIELSDAQFVTFTVPEVARNGAVLDLSMCPPGIRPFKVCVRAFRVHPDEYQVV